MNSRAISPRTYGAVFAALLALTGLTTAVSFMDLGPFNTPLALALAAVKGSLVAVYFMHLRVSSRVVWVFAATGFFWLGILIALIFSDYGTRGGVGEPAGAPNSRGAQGGQKATILPARTLLMNRAARAASRTAGGLPVARARRRRGGGACPWGAPSGFPFPLADSAGRAEAPAHRGNPAGGAGTVSGDPSGSSEPLHRVLRAELGDRP